MKTKNQQSNIISGRDSTVHGDFIAGNKIDKKQSNEVRMPFVEIDLGTRISSQGNYEADFRFRNVGDSAATLQSLSIAGERMQIMRKTLAPGDPAYEIRLNLTGAKIRNNKISNPKVIVKYKSLSGTVYKTTARIAQGSRAVGTFNIDAIEDNEFKIMEKQ